MNDIQRELKLLLVAAAVLAVSLVALTFVGAVVGLAWEFLCRVVPLVPFCAVVSAAVVGGLWLIVRVARVPGGELACADDTTAKNQLLRICAKMVGI